MIEDHFYNSDAELWSFRKGKRLFFCFRHYKLEAALAAMTWRIRWEELNGDDKEKRKKEKEKNKKYEETFFGYQQKNQTNGLMRSESRSSWAKTVMERFLLFFRNFSSSKEVYPEHSLIQSIASEETIALNDAQQIFTKTASYKVMIWSHICGRSKQFRVLL